MKAQRRRYNHLATTWTHSPRWNYSRIIPERRPPGWSPLRQGAGKNFRSPHLSRDDGGGGYRRFCGFLIRCLGFLHRGLLIGEEARLEGGQGAHTLPTCGLGWARAWGVRSPCGAPPSLLWTSCSPLWNIDFGFFPSNSENIHFLTSWNQKQ